jgi:RNA polymerase sigma-70 factor (ECF subfamily)
MSTGRRTRVPIVTLVEAMPDPAERNGRDREGAGLSRPGPRELDWSILMARAQGGDRAAYHRLLNEITPYLESLAARRHRDLDDVEDAVQDILLTVHALRHIYDPNRPFGPWLVAIATRRITDRLRRHGRRRSRETPLTIEHETFSTGPTNHIEEHADRRSLLEAVERLPPGQRDAIHLLKLRQMSLQDAAEVTGMSIASLKVATHRALKALRKMLASESADP